MLESEKLWLIDYEYAGISFRAWDFALMCAEVSIAYDEGQPFVYHPEHNWDLNSEEVEVMLATYLGTSSNN